MPNLRGTSPVSRDGEGRSYTTRAVSRGWPSRRCHGRGEVLSTGLITTIPADRGGMSRELGWGGHARAAGSTRRGSRERARGHSA